MILSVRGWRRRLDGTDVVSPSYWLRLRLLSCNSASPVSQSRSAVGSGLQAPGWRPRDGVRASRKRVQSTKRIQIGSTLILLPFGEVPSSKTENRFLAKRVKHQPRFEASSNHSTRQLENLGPVCQSPGWTGRSEFHPSLRPAGR